MADPVYLDTSALVRRAEASLPSPSPRNAHAGAPVSRILGPPSVHVATCEIGLYEFHDVVISLWRDTDPSLREHDEAWADAAVSTLMADIAEARLAVKPVAPRAYEQAMSLVTMATRAHGRKLRFWDAVHLVTATAWATELGQRVELWTTDNDFAGFIELYPYFKRSLAVKNLDH